MRKRPKRVMMAVKTEVVIKGVTPALLLASFRDTVQLTLYGAGVGALALHAMEKSMDYLSLAFRPAGGHRPLASWCRELPLSPVCPAPAPHPWLAPFMAARMSLSLLPSTGPRLRLPSLAPRRGLQRTDHATSSARLASLTLPASVKAAGSLLNMLSGQYSLSPGHSKQTDENAHALGPRRSGQAGYRPSAAGSSGAGCVSRQPRLQYLKT
ncbi:unnamed protein product [Rangifer tarandus platyrhynchus]|uniref:Uncharacterized protein n=1 Tax=Rangifer tarandus platyrhynchus TaxID=3082113 RepID=A0AC59YX00_RANTA